LVDPDDPLVMIEDAPGRFREEWVQCAPGGEVEFVRAAGVICVRVGDITGVVLSTAEGVAGRLWCADYSIAVEPPSRLDQRSSSS
jgi:hypothetical protein